MNTEYKLRQYIDKLKKCRGANARLEMARMITDGEPDSKLRPILRKLNLTGGFSM